MFKPIPRHNVEDRASMPQAPAAVETKTHATPTLPLFMGVLSLILSLVPVCMGIYEFEIVQKPSNLPLASFDALLRKAGTLFPFIPLILRCLVQSQVNHEGQATLPWFFKCVPSMAQHVGIQAVRLALYKLHVLGQQHGVVAGDLLADHCVLGVAVQSALAFEIAASMYVLSVSTAETVAAILYTIAASCAWFLLVLVSFDMRDTAKYFHDAEESLLGVALGVAVFAIPVCYVLLTPVLQRLQNSPKNGKKGM